MNGYIALDRGSRRGKFSGHVASGFAPLTPAADSAMLN
jgi:hypothetical protein